MVGALIYHDYVGCANEGGASFAIDALRSSAHPTALGKAKGGKAARFTSFKELDLIGNLPFRLLHENF